MTESQPDNEPPTLDAMASDLAAAATDSFVAEWSDARDAFMVRVDGLAAAVAASSITFTSGEEQGISSVISLAATLDD